MTQPNIKDTNAQAGAHPGVGSMAELSAKVKTTIGKTFDNLSEAAEQTIRSAEWSLNSTEDSGQVAKYAIDPSVNFLGSGSLSLVPRLGKFLFTAVSNEPGKGALGIDHGNSALFSDMKTTTLGSLDIDTVDGQMLNPVSPTFPSTNYSPTKPWIRKLFPSFSVKDLTKIAILELVAVTLYKMVDDKKSSENSDRKQSDTDMATIIVDNQEIEDALFRNN
ncbi:MAG: hypothetical protein KDH96_10415 [Candidatus Riesia sp.]|nr:hypothetical protein [Candidatus Riesia sp.]